jgi:predicted DNA-binding antitoxin AbrB/MazE fold protein
MTITIRAIYESGVLRPVEPLALSEGETVDVTIAQARFAGSQPRDPTSAEADYAQRIKSARSLEEMYTLMASAPPSPEGYDLCEALNANRIATGERVLYPEAKDGGG